MKINKKGNFGIGLFWFFFALMFISGIFFFIFTALPAMLSTYGIDIAVDANQDLVDLGVSSAASQNSINAIANSFTNLYKFGDYAFMFIIVSLFIESCIAAKNARRGGIYSFFGLMTLGNVILVFIMSYAIHIRGWFLNEIVYNILTISIETRFFDWFFSNSYYIGMVWYAILLVINMVDFGAMLSRIPFITSNEKKMRFEE